MEGKPMGRNISLRKRFIDKGAGVFFDEELIETLLGYNSNHCDHSRIALSLKLHFEDMSRFISASAEEFKRIKGVDGKSALFLSITGLLCRRCLEQRQRELIISSPARAARFLAPRFMDMTTESTMMVCLNEDLSFISCVTLCTGDVAENSPDPYNALRAARECDSCVIILAHNHPSASPVPSGDDMFFTSRLLNSFRRLGIILLDHIIISHDRYTSMAENGFFKSENESLRDLYMKNTEGRDISWATIVGTGRGKEHK